MYPEARWKYTALANRMGAYYEAHEWIRLDPEARNKSHTTITESDDCTRWTIEQTLIDPGALNDVQIVFELSIQSAKEHGVIQLELTEIRSIVD
jgi:hypothetical protein